MPPLSAYTPFESLLFFQCLASLNARPTNFAAISDTLRKNQFIKEDDTFDTDRLSPQALEELYTTLLQDEFDESSSSVGDKNSHLQDGASPNPKKRKITTAGATPQSHTAIVPGLVSQLYARYKDRVIKEIRDEEKRYREIREEIERLQKDALQEPAGLALQENKVSTGAVINKQVAGELMDVDIKEDVNKPTQNVIPPTKTAPEQGLVDAHVRPTTTTPGPIPAGLPPAISSRPGLVPPPAVANKPQPQPSAVLAPREPVLQQPHPQQLTTVPPTSKQALPPVASTPPIKTPINGKGMPLAPQPPSTLQPSPKIQVKVPPPPLPQRLPPQQATSRGGRNQPNLPPGSTIVFQAQQGASLPATPTSQRLAPAGENIFPKGAPVPVGSPAVSQLPPGQQQQFQQWAPHSQSGVFPATPHAPSPYNNQLMMDRSMMPKPGTFIPHPDGAGKPISSAPHGHGPATPGQFPNVIQTPVAQMQKHTTPLTGTPTISGLKQKRPHRTSMDTAGSLTPWKRTPDLHIKIPEPLGSPPRPKPEDVSPISETELSPIEPAESLAKDISPQRRRGRPEAESIRRGRKQSVPATESENVILRNEKSTVISGIKRAGSTTSIRSRARSVTSRDEESATDSVTAQRRIKNEAPSTPAGVSEDVEMETRAGTRRRTTGATIVGEDTQVKTRPKRKRGASEALEVDITRPTPSRNVSSQLVYCTRNFPRTGAPIMNDVTSHKHASIFAKPLTEREAPGYRNLIYRPQDLKSIKSALNQGNKAVAAATEAASTTAEGESPLPTSGTPSKNTAWLTKTPELIPPKAIVNSSQLEKELIRMFANAIMFNPAPEQERGFGSSFRMLRSNASSRSSSSHPWDLDEGGISRDTREMCDDVEKAVTKWRAAERTTTDDSANKSMLSLRGSSGDSNADGMDDNKG